MSFLPKPDQARMERTDYGTLLIPEMKVSDAGTYLCIGTNAVGSSEAVIEVTVIRGEQKTEKKHFERYEMHVLVQIRAGQFF